MTPATAIPDSAPVPSAFDEVRALLPNSGEEVVQMMGTLVAIARELPDLDPVELLMWNARALHMVTVSLR